MTETTEYQAWRVHEKDGKYVGAEETLSTDDLPDNDVLIRVSHSSLNYKDALSAAGNKGVTRSFPHTPGIDAAGEVVASKSGNPTLGQKVLVTGYDLGMNTPGGFGEYIRVPSGWCVPMPSAWSAHTAMIYGTAGLTAGLCVDKLLRMGLKPEQGKVVVTGASGAVGTVAVELLAKLGYEVVAISGKDKQHGELKKLGASEIRGRNELDHEKKPLVRPEFAGAVDTVGGGALAELLKRIQPGGSVACCGLVAGTEVQTTVLPFILRGVNLLGVDSVEIPAAEKQAIWDKLSGPWRCAKTEASARDIGRSGLDDALKAFLAGDSHGKIVLDHSR
ncbi:MAG: YhdH/YhfP family quinone oxidoreductase [Marinobacter sp.]|uniref:YhdH/YhfP family quinone oxidoreductase n=1 Tax=Marinobacter sp. TaxID=50741 RepID=UPI00299D2E69|nr:YhdH/YhfP family quinone oxidoreductase [Marinobacter sp.]MDX1633099.1 YhdH/YhfP family quinone oxidoreductase [Marinobacter sp.]